MKTQKTKISGGEKMKSSGEKFKTLAQNKKAYHEYFIEETYEAGIELVGTEVKSIRAGKMNLKDSFARIKDGEVYLLNMHVSPYEQGNIFNRDPVRTRKLLLHKEEIRKINIKIQQLGYSLIPTKAYLLHGKVKIEIGVAKGKKLYDKREDAAKKDASRQISRNLKEYNKSI